MRKLLILSLIFTFIPINSFSQDKIDEMRKEIAIIKEKLSSVNQQIDDLDKKLSQRIDDVDKKLNHRIDDVNNRIGDLKDIIFGGFTIIIGGLGVLATGMVALVGFVLWDRRTALAPAIKAIEEVKEKEKIVEETLKIYAKKNIEFKKAMETTGLIPKTA